MNTFLDFVRTAAPWAAVGLLVIILAIRGASKDNDNEQDDTYCMEGMCLGMCLGSAIGSAFGNDTGIGIALGMLLGLAVGMCIPKKLKDEKQ